MNNGRMLNQVMLHLRKQKSNCDDGQVDAARSRPAILIIYANVENWRH